MRSREFCNFVEQSMRELSLVQTQQGHPKERIRQKIDSVDSLDTGTKNIPITFREKIRKYPFVFANFSRNFSFFSWKGMKQKMRKRSEISRKYTYCIPNIMYFLMNFLASKNIFFSRNFRFLFSRNLRIPFFRKIFAFFTLRKFFIFLKNRLKWSFAKKLKFSYFSQANKMQKAKIFVNNFFPAKNTKLSRNDFVFFSLETLIPIHEFLDDKKLSNKYTSIENAKKEDDWLTPVMNF